jgi:DNA polymerase III epsilon subunit-like protein
MLSWSFKWLDGKHITKGLCDYKTFKKDKTNDKELVTELWELFNEADILIAHNGDRFDRRKSNTRFLKHHLTPPQPYQTIDT